MKILIMCEGPNECEVVNILLENNKLIFSEHDLLGLEVYHARQIKTSAKVRTELNIYPGIFDSMTKDEMVEEIDSYVAE